MPNLLLWILPNDLSGNFTNSAFHAMRTDGEMFWVIREGIPGTAMMPMVGSVITEEEAWLVLLYERSLGKR